jgi:hypothetical protein
VLLKKNFSARLCHPDAAFASARCAPARAQLDVLYVASRKIDAQELRNSQGFLQFRK